MAADLSEDVAELKSLLAQATRPHVQSLISTEIQTLEKVKPVNNKKEEVEDDDQGFKSFSLTC